MSARAVWIASVLVLCASGCIGTPPESAAQNVLPDDGIEDGPEHRAGQPCITCHSGSFAFGSGPAFSVAGTVYANALDATGRRGATVTVTDFTGREISLLTNLVGNFYFNAELVFPVRVRVEDASIPACREMQTRVLRDGNCNRCHTAHRNAESPGRVWLRDGHEP